jgi:hypothetical protein
VARVPLLDFGDQALAWFGLEKGRGLSREGLGINQRAAWAATFWEFGGIWGMGRLRDTSEPRALVKRDNIKRLSLAPVVILFVTVAYLALVGVGPFTNEPCCLPYPTGLAA